MAKRVLCSAVFLLLSFQSIRAQIDKRSPLFIELKKQDSIFFELSFNQCDIEYLEAAIADDLKFFHDQSGFQNREIFLENIKKYICLGQAKKPIRKLAEESLEAFPLYNNGTLYGAIQHGIHHFYIREPGKEDIWTSTAKFTSVWLLQNSSWKLSEVLSYDHQNIKPGALKGNDTNNLNKVSHVPEINLATIEDGVPANVRTKIILVENSLPDVALSKDPSQKYNLIDRMMLYKVPSVSIAVINNGKVEWAKAYGYADIAEKKPANTETIYQVASLTKSVNAFYILKLVQEGKLSLNTDIRNYLKTWKIPENEFSEGKKITIKNLLSHTGGFGTGGFIGYLKTDSLPTINQILNGEKPANSEAIRAVLPVNNRFSYSGGGTVITRKIIEDNISCEYDSLIEENVLKPLGMRHSTFQKILPAGFKNFATAYDAGIREVPGKYNIYPELAPDGLWSTPTDIAGFIISIQNSLADKPNAALNNKTATEMLTPVLNTSDIALGTFIIERSGEKYFTHLGGNRGFQSIYYGSFTTGKGIVILTNTDNAHPTLIKEIVSSVASVYQWTGF